MNKHKILSLVSILTILLSLSGCSLNEDDSDSIDESSSEELIDDIDIVMSILDNAARMSFDDFLSSWSGVHATVSLENETNVAFLTLEQDNLYGYWYQENNKENTTIEKYISGGTEYTHTLNLVSGLEDFTSQSDEYTYIDIAQYQSELDFTKPFSFASSIVGEITSLDDFSFRLTIKDEVYTLTVSNEKETYTYGADDEYNLTKFGCALTNEVKEYILEDIPYNQVENAMSKFNPSLWINAKTPAQLIEKINVGGNYTLSLRVDEYISDSILEEDYNNDNYDLDAVLDTLAFDSRYYYTIKYNEDSVLCEASLDGVTPIVDVLYVNGYNRRFGGDFQYCFLSDYGGDFYYEDIYEGHWQDTYHSFFNLTSLTESHFNYVASLEDDNGYYDDYSVDDFYTTVYLAGCTGSDWHYGKNNLGVYARYMEVDDVRYYTDFQEMAIDLSWALWFYEDYSYSTRVVVEDYLYAYIYDAGTTDFSSIVDGCLALLDD